MLLDVLDAQYKWHINNKFVFNLVILRDGGGRTSVNCCVPMSQCLLALVTARLR